MTNDSLLDQLRQYIGETLKFFPIVEIVPGLRGGLYDDRADGAAAYSAKGAPVVALDGGWERWPAERLRYVFLHECAHHRLKHTNPAMRATAAHGVVYERTAANEQYTARIERQADDVTKSYEKGFDAWRLKKLEADVQLIKWILKQQGVRVK